MSKKILSFEEYVHDAGNSEEIKKEVVPSSEVSEARKVKFILYTNPGNSTGAGYVAIGTEDVKEVLADAKKYSDSYNILYQGSGTQADLLKAKQMFSNYRFGNESIDESTTNESLIKEETKLVSEMLKEVYESACKEAEAYETDEYGEHTVESYLKEMASLHAGMMSEMYEKAYSSVKEAEMTLEVYEAMCEGMKESYVKKIDEVKEAYSAR